MKRPRARIHFLPFRDTTERVAASTDGRTLAKGRLHDAVPRTQLGYTLAAWYAAQSCGSVHPPLGSFVTSISASASMLITLRFPTSRPVLRLSPRDVACRTCAKCRRHTESNLLVSPVVLGVGVVATPLTCLCKLAQREGTSRGLNFRPPHLFLCTTPTYLEGALATSVQQHVQRGPSKSCALTLVRGVRSSTPEQRRSTRRNSGTGRAVP